MQSTKFSGFLIGVDEPDTRTDDEPSVISLHELLSLLDRTDSIETKFDKPCGKSHISDRKKCSKDKLAVLTKGLKSGDEGAKRRVAEGEKKAAAKQQLNREVERDRGKKATEIPAAVPNKSTTKTPSNKKAGASIDTPENRKKITKLLGSINVELLGTIDTLDKAIPGSSSLFEKAMAEGSINKSTTGIDSRIETIASLIKSPRRIGKKDLGQIGDAIGMASGGGIGKTGKLDNAQKLLTKSLEHFWDTLSETQKNTVSRDSFGAKDTSESIKEFQSSKLGKDLIRRQSAYKELQRKNQEKGDIWGFDSRTDDASPVQRVFKFDGYDIGLQYLPGDTRHDRVLKVGYGHIRETKAEDGMALDCYVHKRVCSQERNPAEFPIFAITQLDQEGEFDELKLMIGWASEEGAIASYITAMPIELFGGIEQFSEDDLNQYWQDAADSEDDDEEEDHEDAFPKVKRMLDVGNVKLAITHDPMESRFPQGRPMRSHYGFISGSYGQADDGKAYDVYVHPNHANAEPTLFQIVQTTSEGEPDESKFMAYYPSMREAKDDFIYHAGSERFGYIRPFEWEAFDPEEFEDEDEDLDELEDEDELLGES